MTIQGDLPGDATNGVLVQMSGAGGAGGSAAADAESNATALGATRSRNMSFNGTTWDRVRSGITAIGSVFTGFLNTLPWAVFHTAPTARTDGQGGPLEADASGNLQINVATLIAGENQTTNRMMVEHAYSNARVTASGATNAIKSGTWFLHSISVDKWVSGLVIDIYDALTVTGTPIRKITLSTTDTGPIPPGVIDVAGAVGLTVNLSVAGDVGISYR